MADELTPTTIVKASEARQRFSELVNRVHDTGERIVIEKNGAAMAGIVSREDLRDLDWMDRQRQREQAALARIRDGFRDVSEEEMEREVEKALAESRQEAREAVSKREPARR